MIALPYLRFPIPQDVRLSAQVCTHRISRMRILMPETTGRDADSVQTFDLIQAYCKRGLWKDRPCDSRGFAL